MLVIDSHQHFWNYDSVKHNWISDDMALLQKDFKPGDLQKVLVKNGVDGCISVQAEQSEDETDFLLSLAAENDFIKGVVGWVDLCSTNINDRLEFYSQNHKLKGFRHVVQDEPDVNFMLKDEFQYGLSCFEKHNFTYDILIFPKQFKAALETVKNFPNINFIIDHIAKPNIEQGETAGWDKAMRSLAEHPNVSCKISGMVTEADWKNWSYNDFTPYLDIVFDAFGTDRIMFGSDWPVCLLGGSYERIKGIIEQYVHNFPADDKAKIWGLNALNFYNIEIESPGLDGFNMRM